MSPEAWIKLQIASRFQDHKPVSAKMFQRKRWANYQLLKENL